MSNNPSRKTTINSSSVTNGSGLGSFSCEMTNLQNNTTYYVRAWARNTNGVSYGAERTFKTEVLPTFQYGGNTYYVAPDPGSIVSWNEANSYCNGLSIYGLSGWRLPTKDELLQMYAERTSIGGFDCSYLGTPYWSSTLAPDNYHYYYVFFSDGDIWYYHGTYNCNYTDCRIRPIRRKN